MFDLATYRDVILPSPLGAEVRFTENRRAVWTPTGAATCCLDRYVIQILWSIFNAGSHPSGINLKESNFILPTRKARLGRTTANEVELKIQYNQ
jgi:hypothetical protein